MTFVQAGPFVGDTGRRSPICCIVPPHMLDSIRLRGTQEQREMAVELGATAVEYRALREVATPERAGTPEFVGAMPACAPGATPVREVWDAQQGFDLPGPDLARSEGDPPTGDQEVDEAYEGAGDTYDLYASEYGRDSLDGHGMKLVSSVHVRQNYNNAFWNGSQMAYGDGDGQIFVPLTRSLSVIGHELSHGVVQFSGGLVYQDQAGALNESFADVFGVLVVQRKRGEEAHEASWLVGDGILAPGVNGVALRSMKAPGTAYDDPVLGRDPQPYEMDGYVVTSADNGGVHINSGIPNHAFYLPRPVPGWACMGAGRSCLVRRAASREQPACDLPRVGGADSRGCMDPIRRGVCRGAIHAPGLEARRSPLGWTGEDQRPTVWRHRGSAGRWCGRDRGAPPGVPQKDRSDHAGGASGWGGRAVGTRVPRSSRPLPVRREHTRRELVPLRRDPGHRARPSARRSRRRDRAPSPRRFTGRLRGARGASAALERVRDPRPRVESSNGW